MDTRRYLIAGLGAGLASCAGLESAEPPITLAGPSLAVVTARDPMPAEIVPPDVGRPYLEVVGAPGADRIDLAVEDSDAAVVRPARVGRAAIAAANLQARAASRSDQFVGGVQVFAWAPGRVFEVWTAPLRVTTLTLAPGETVVSKAAGDTVRWQIGETTSGAGAGARTHVLLKPLERGLETNLVLTTSHRVYLLDLRSGSADGFNTAIAWDPPLTGASEDGAVDGETTPDPGVVRPQGQLDARYAIRPRGRAPGWMPTAVFDDGVRTFITFPPQVWVEEVPALFVLGADGQAQLVNYRQAGGLFIVDRMFDRAELRLGEGRRPRVVRLERLAGDRT